MYMECCVILWPGAACCPEVYRDVPGMFHDDDDDYYEDEHGDAESRNVVRG